MKAKPGLSVIMLAAFFYTTNSVAANLTPAQELVFDRNKGNCLACHALPNDPAAQSPGNIGPALIGMNMRFPDRAKLRAQIWDPTVNNPLTGMPPFGKNKILTEAEIDQVTDYLLKQ